MLQPVRLSTLNFQPSTARKWSATVGKVQEAVNGEPCHPEALVSGPDFLRLPARRNQNPITIELLFLIPQFQRLRPPQRRLPRVAHERPGVGSEKIVREKRSLHCAVPSAHLHRGFDVAIGRVGHRLRNALPDVAACQRHERNRATVRRVFSAHGIIRLSHDLRIAGKPVAKFSVLQFQDRRLEHAIEKINAFLRDLDWRGFGLCSDARDQREQQKRNYRFHNHLSRCNKYVASASSASALPLKIFSALNALFVSSSAMLRDFSNPTIDGYVAFCAFVSLPAVLPSCSVVCVMSRMSSMIWNARPTL